ncbi:MAG: hypothetical protein KAT28_03190 [Candidatus Aenigmarchaeota archaeon]|nr:hypothetical protein [Candidatus Aenigmarchaeota archaeon]
MKGQHKIINELLLFGIGALVTLSLAGTVASFVTSLQRQAQTEQYYIISNLVSMATTKAYLCGKSADCSITVDIPEKLSDARYTISLSKNHINVRNFRSDKGITRKLLNLEYILTNGLATSSAGYFILSSTEGNIRISR